MSASASSPDVDFGIWVGVATYQSQDRSLIVIRLKDSGHDSLEFKRDQVNSHSDAAQIVLNDGRHLCPLCIAGTGHNRKFHWVAVNIYQRSVVPNGETCRAKQRGCSFRRSRKMGDFRINPALVSWSNVPPKRRRASLIHQTADGIAVDSRGDGLAKLVTPEPFLLSADLRKLS